MKFFLSIIFDVVDAQSIIIVERACSNGNYVVGEYKITTSEHTHVLDK